MQICLITAIHGRHELAARMLAHYAGMRDRLPYALEIVACMSPEDIRGMAGNCDTAGVEWLACNNWPVSAKWQSSLNYALTMFQRMDALMIMGSDDFASESYMLHVPKIIEAGSPAFGPDIVHFYDVATGNLVRFDTRPGGIPAGAGRVITRDTLCRAKWCLWPRPQNRALDALCSRTLGRHGIAIDFVDMDGSEAYVIDVKNGHNIHGIEEFPAENIVEKERAEQIVTACGIGSI